MSSFSAANTACWRRLKASSCFFPAVPDRLPDYCRVRIDGVSRKEAEAYQQTMEKAGISPVSQKEEDGALFLLYRYDNTSFSVEWQDDTMTFLMVDDPLCFVPIWYLLAGNAAD